MIWRVDTKNLITQSFGKSRIDRQNHDQGDDPDGDADHRDQRDQRNKAMPMLGPQIPPADEPLVHISRCPSVWSVVWSSCDLFFRLHMREKDDVSDRGRIGQQHDQPVNPDALSGSRRHAVLQGTDIIDIEYRMYLIIIAPFGNLFLKAFSLVDRIVQFAEGVGNLPAGDKQFKAIGDTRVVLVAPGQRRDFGRVGGDKGRIDQFFLDQEFE